MEFTRTEGIEVKTAQTILSEVGLDTSKWKTEGTLRVGCAHVQTIRRRRQSTAPGDAHDSKLGCHGVRIAASTFRRSDSYLGARFRRLRSRLGAPKAITAMANDLLFCRGLCFG